MQGQLMDNNSYNVIQALASSLEAIEAYRKYAKDGNPQLWEQIANHQGQIVQLLKQELPKIAQNSQSSQTQNYGATASQGQSNLNQR